MKDLAEEELHAGDLVVYCSGYHRRLSLGIIRKFTNNIHIYSLDSSGLALAIKDKGLKLLPGMYASTRYVIDGTSILKISKSLLQGQHLTYYEEITKTLNKNVATTDNT